MVSSSLSIFLLLAAAVCATWAIGQFNFLLEKRAELQSLSNTVSYMKQTAIEYDPEVAERFQQQWSALEARANASIGKIQQFETLGIGYRSEIFSRLDAISTAFLQITKIDESNPIATRIGRTLVTRITGQADGIIARLSEELTSVGLAKKNTVILIATIVGLALFVALAVTIFFAGLMRVQVLPDLEALKGEMKRIGAGEFEHPVDTTRHDEIGDLHRSVNAMRESLMKLTFDLNLRRLEAEKADRAKTDFLAMMSHELRTPLNAVIGFSEMLSHPDQMDVDAAQQAKFAKHIQASGEHLLGLISDLLDFAKIDSEDYELEATSFDFKEMIANAESSFFQRALENNTKIVFNTVEAPTLINSDPTRIRQVIFNLVDNAIKFSADATVSVTALGERVDGRNMRLIVIVDDTGIGIDRDKAAVIFDLFTQADATITRQFGGSGLGLSISKRICQALGGDITVTSKTGEGSQFVATFIVEDLSDIASKLKERLLPVGHNTNERFNLNVLVVDDVETNLDVIESILGRVGCRITKARNGAEAVSISQQEDFDVIFMDLHMPVMDGAMAAAEIRQKGARNRATPIFAWTADIMRQNDLDQNDDWAGILFKPSAQKDVVSIVRAVSLTGPQSIH